MANGKKKPGPLAGGRGGKSKLKNLKVSDADIAAELAGHIASAMARWRGAAGHAENVLETMKKRQKKKRSIDLKKQQIGSAMKRGGRVRRKAKY